MREDPRLDRAQLLLAVRRPAQARSLLVSTLQDDPEDPEALCLLAQAELDLDQPARARDLAARATATRPGDAWPLHLIAAAELALRRPHRALSAAVHAVERAPHSWQAHHLLSVCLLERGDPTRALAAATPAREFDTQAPHAHAQVALCLAALHRHSDADRAARSALALAPNDPDLLRQHSAVQLAAGDRPRAVASMAGALAMDPTERASQRAFRSLFRDLFRRALLLTLLTLVAAAWVAVSLAARSGPHVIGWAVAPQATSAFIAYAGLRLHAGLSRVSEPARSRLVAGYLGSRELWQDVALVASVALALALLPLLPGQVAASVGTVAAVTGLRLLVGLQPFEAASGELPPDSVPVTVALGLLGAAMVAVGPWAAATTGEPRSLIFIIPGLVLLAVVRRRHRRRDRLRRLL